MSRTTAMGQFVVLELIDSSSGESMQVWRFSAPERISIGRASENDVVVSNPYVSRAHAYLQRDDRGWWAIAISHQQLVADGRRLSTLELRNGVVFRLGPQGCHLRFGETSAPETAPSGLATLAFDPGACPILHLDREQLQREVNQIADGDYFQNLSKSVRHLRQAYASNPPPPQPGFITDVQG